MSFIYICCDSSHILTTDIYVLYIVSFFFARYSCTNTFSLFIFLSSVATLYTRKGEERGKGKGKELEIS
ncbi:hypothetical protein M426DRAFT_93000 [Hypoxylon sp. CI-4A]|nr:hypothetical protein M426DRAFT_93000 [Hypoxylon sp. CI-4A]